MSDRNLNIMQVGGQAVIEGVMMRAPGKVATAVRRISGEILVKVQNYKSFTEKYPRSNVPVFRGAILLIDMMILGMKTLQWSADIALEDDRLKREVPEKNNFQRSANSGRSLSGETGTMNKWQTFSTMVFAIILGLALFIVLPLYVTSNLFSLEQTAFSFNLVSGFIRITIFLLYLWVISKMKDVFRLFQYHGAEHKSIFAYESGEAVTIANASQYSRFHPRCGTSFLVMTLVIAILSFSALDAVVIAFLGKLTLPIRLLTHIPLIPVVGGIGYEIIKFSAKHSDRLWVRTLIAPGLWLQRITTEEPDGKQLEVGIVALKAALGMNYSEHLSVNESLVTAVVL